MKQARDAIRAAYFRVDPEADPVAVEREVAWVLSSHTPVMSKRRIAWPLLAVGRRLRTVLMAEQEGRCCYCACELQERGPMQMRPTFEHIVPLGCGGQDHPDNLALACEPCNQRVGRAAEDARKAAAMVGL